MTTTRPRKKREVSTLPRVSSHPVSEPPVPITIRFMASFRPRWGDFVRYVLGWELHMDQHITFPRGDVTEPAHLRDVRLVPFAPPWWEWMRGLWQTKQ